MSTDKPTVTLHMTLEEAEALESLFHRRPDLWRRHAKFADVGYPDRLPKALRRALAEAGRR